MGERGALRSCRRDHRILRPGSPHHGPRVRQPRPVLPRVPEPGHPRQPDPRRRRTGELADALGRPDRLRVRGSVRLRCGVLVHGVPGRSVRRRFHARSSRRFGERPRLARRAPERIGRFAAGRDRELGDDGRGRRGVGRRLLPRRRGPRRLQHADAGRLDQLGQPPGVRGPGRPAERLRLRQAPRRGGRLSGRGRRREREVRWGQQAREASGRVEGRQEGRTEGALLGQGRQPRPGHRAEGQGRGRQARDRRGVGHRGGLRLRLRPGVDQRREDVQERPLQRLDPRAARARIRGELERVRHREVQPEEVRGPARAPRLPLRDGPGSAAQGLLGGRGGPGRPPDLERDVTAGVGSPRRRSIPSTSRDGSSGWSRSTRRPTRFGSARSRSMPASTDPCRAPTWTRSSGPRAAPCRRSSRSWTAARPSSRRLRTPSP